MAQGVEAAGGCAPMRATIERSPRAGGRGLGSVMVVWGFCPRWVVMMRRRSSPRMRRAAEASVGAWKRGSKKREERVRRGVMVPRVKGVSPVPWMRHTPTLRPAWRADFSASWGSKVICRFRS